MRTRMHVCVQGKRSTQHSSKSGSGVAAAPQPQRLSSVGAVLGSEGSFGVRRKSGALADVCENQEMEIEEDEEGEEEVEGGGLGGMKAGAGQVEEQGQLEMGLEGEASGVSLQASKSARIALR